MGYMKTFKEDSFYGEYIFKTDFILEITKFSSVLK